MSKMPNGFCDLVLTSPPYNMGGKSLGYQPRSKIADKHYDVYCDDRNNGEYVEWILKVVGECLRVSRYVFFNIQFLNSTRDAIFALQEKYKGNIKDIFIWKKQAVANITAKNGGMAKGWEYVFLLGQDDAMNFSYHNFPENGYVPNIKDWYKKETFKEHHATFTQEMAGYFVSYFTKPNDTIYDCFMGTGTTAVAAIKYNRNFIGSEISEKYCQIANKRIEPLQMQQTLNFNN